MDALAAPAIDQSAPPPPAPAAAGGNPADAQGPAKNPFLQKRLNDICKRASVYFDRQRTRGEKYKAQYIAGELDETRDPSDLTKKGMNENQVIANFTFSYITKVMSILAAEDPSIQVEPNENAGGADEYFMGLVLQGIVPDIATAQRLYADAVEAVNERAWHCTQMGAHVKQTLFEALVNNIGWVKAGWDDPKGLPRLDALMRHEVYADPHARFDVSQARYLVHIVTMPIEDAQEFFLAKANAIRAILTEDGVNPADPANAYMLSNTFNPYTLKANEQSTADGLLTSGLDAGRDKDEKGDQFRFYEIWMREANGQNWVYYRTVDGNEGAQVNFRMPWPFTLPDNEFPFCNLNFFRVGRRLDDGFSDIRIVDGLRKVYDSILLYMRKFVLRAIAKKLMYDKNLDAESVQKLLSAEEELQGIPVDMNLFPKGSDIARILDINVGDNVAMELAEFIDREIGRVLGSDELDQNGDTQQGDMSATEAKIRDNNAQPRRRQRRETFDAFQARVLGLVTAIARQKVDSQKVYRIAGKDAAQVWDLHGASPDAFNEEYDVSVLAGSSGITHRQEVTEQLKELMGLLSQVNAGAVQSGKPPRWDIEAIAADLAQFISRNSDRYRLKTPPMQPGMPPVQPGPAGLPPAGVAGGPVPPPAAQMNPGTAGILPASGAAGFQPAEVAA